MTAWPCVLIGHRLVLVNSDVDQAAICLRCGLAVPVFDPLWERRPPPGVTPPPAEPDAEPVRPTRQPTEPPRPDWPTARPKPPV